MKVYLLSKVDCYTDESMQKEHLLFSTFEEACVYKEELVKAIKADLMEHYEVENEDELYDMIDITSDNDWIWGYLNCDCTHEVEVEIEELDVMTFKKC
jgi:hypothetical protein